MKTFRTRTVRVARISRAVKSLIVFGDAGGGWYAEEQRLLPKHPADQSFQYCRELNPQQGCREIVQKSSKIAPLGAPFFPIPIKLRAFVQLNYRARAIFPRV